MGYFKFLTIFIVNYLAVSEARAKDDCPFNVQGLIAPVFTPVNNNGSLNLSVISGYAQYLKDNDVDGICIAGFTGEGPTLSVAEMKSLIAAWLTAVDSLDLTVTAFIGGRPFPDVVELARYCENQDLDAIITLPDLFYKPETYEDLVYATGIIADAAPNTPLIYYDAPIYTDVEIDIVDFYNFATERIPTFKGVAIDNCDDGLRLLPILNDDQRIFICNASYLAPAVYLGIDSFAFTEINMFPDLVQQIVDEGSQGNLNETNSLFVELLNLSDAILDAGEEIPAYKVAMTILTGIDVGRPRNPNQALTEDEEDDLQESLENLDQDIVVSSDAI